GDNVLISGATDFDANDVALTSLLAEWSRLDLGTSAASYDTRLKHLQGTLAGGNNGAFLLNATTVHDNGVRDYLYGGTGLNWYLAHVVAGTVVNIVNKKSNEVISNI